MIRGSKMSEPTIEERKKINPCEDIIWAIQHKDIYLIKASQLHGHYCPGLALGVLSRCICNGSVDSVICESCQESMMATRIVEQEGKQLCRACARSDYYGFTGDGIVLIKP